jgi:hypothetical protein
MVAGDINGQRSANTQAPNLIAHIHSFFVHLGAARDHLGALVAHRIGLDYKKCDSIARLAGELREAALSDDALLTFLFETGCISANPKKPGGYVVAGWMENVTAIRNELVHKRPYGSKYAERFGCVVPAQKDAGIYRYVRSLHLNASAGQDVLDVIQYHYARCTDLFYKAAKASGGDASMWHLTDKDVISFEIA